MNGFFDLPEVADQFVRYNIGLFGLPGISVLIFQIIALIFIFHFFNYKETLNGKGFFLFSKINLKFPFWSSVVLFFAILIYLFLGGESLNRFLLGPWSPIFALINFFIQYLVAAIFKKLNIDRVGKLVQYLVACSMVLLVPFVIYYSIYKYSRSDVLKWGAMAAEKNNPYICYNVVGANQKTIGENQSKCIIRAAQLSGDLSYCDIILDSKRNSECVNDLTLAYQVSKDLCGRGEGEYDFVCVSRYCDLSDANYLSIPECFLKRAYDESDLSWCERLAGGVNKNMREKCVSTYYFTIAEKSMQKDWCEKMTGRTTFGDDVQVCFDNVEKIYLTDMALTDRNIKVCDEIASQYGAEYCGVRVDSMEQAKIFYDKALKTGDVKWCENIRVYENANKRWLSKWDFSVNQCLYEVNLNAKN
ncbi:MAG: hypothetical protein AAB348_03555 [Patescibacteria group bacterium]